MEKFHGKVLIPYEVEFSPQIMLTQMFFIFCFTMDPSGANLLLLEDMSTNF